MGGVLTSGGTAVRRARQSVELTRAQTVGLALLIAVPLPALSLGALVVPLPQLMERAAAGFIPFGSPEVRTAPQRRVVAMAPVRVPRKRRTNAQRPAPTSSTVSTQARRAPVPPRRKRLQKAPGPTRHPPARSATAAVTPETTAPQTTAAAGSGPQPVVATTPPVTKEKPAKGSGREKKARESTAPPASTEPPATSGPGATSGHESNHGAAGSSGESNAGGNGNGNGGSGGDHGGGSGKDSH